MERDKARTELAKLQRGIWRLKELATSGTGKGISVNPFADMEGTEEGPRLNEDQLRQSIMDIKI